MIELIGLVWLTAMWELAVEHPSCRASLPRVEQPADELKLRAHIAKLAEKLREIAMSDRGIERCRALRRPPALPARYDLPIAGSAPAARYEVKDKRLKVVRRGAEWMVSDGAQSRPVAEP